MDEVQVRVAADATAAAEGELSVARAEISGWAARQQLMLAQLQAERDTSKARSAQLIEAQEVGGSGQSFHPERAHSPSLRPSLLKRHSAPLFPPSPSSLLSPSFPLPSSSLPLPPPSSLSRPPLPRRVSVVVCVCARACSGLVIGEAAHRRIEGGRARRRAQGAGTHAGARTVGWLGMAPLVAFSQASRGSNTWLGLICLPTRSEDANTLGLTCSSLSSHKPAVRLTACSLNGSSLSSHKPAVRALTFVWTAREGGRRGGGGAPSGQDE